MILSARSFSGFLRRMKVRLSAINARRKSRYKLTAGGGEGGGQESYGPTRLPPTPPSADDEVCFLNCGTATNVRFDGLRGNPSQRCANAAEHRPAVAKNRDTARQAAAKTERHDPRILRKGRPGSLYCTWSRGPGRARGTRFFAFAESNRSGGKTRPRTDAAATP